MRATNRARRLAWLLAATALAVTAVGGLAAAQSSSDAYRLDGATLESGGGILTSEQYAVEASAGRTAAGEARGGNFAVAPEPVQGATNDACPEVVGLAARQGCDFAAEAVVRVRSGDNVRRVKLAVVKVFDRDRLRGVTITTREGKQVTLTKNPDGSLYDDIYVSDAIPADARAAALGCTTGDRGSCLAGLLRKGDQLLIFRWVAPEGNVVFMGRSYTVEDFFDSNRDGATDLTKRQLQLVRVKKGESVQYRPDPEAKA